MRAGSNALGRNAFDALLTGDKDLVPAMRNDPKDRHVLAAAISTGADVIVSNNKRHFPAEILDTYKLECLTADEFLVGQYQLNPDAFMEVLRKQAAILGRGLPEHLATLGRYAPALGVLIRP